LAIARLALDNIDDVQGSWVTLGTKIGQLSLFFGADDLGSIMLEENVVASAGVKFRMTQGDKERTIREAGLTPRQRRTLYEPQSGVATTKTQRHKGSHEGSVVCSAMRPSKPPPWCSSSCL